MLFWLFSSSFVFNHRDGLDLNRSSKKERFQNLDVVFSYYSLNYIILCTSISPIVSATISKDLKIIKHFFYLFKFLMRRSVIDNLLIIYITFI